MNNSNKIKNVFHEKYGPQSTINLNLETGEVKTVNVKDLIAVQPQGWVFLGILFTMTILYGINPFRKIFASSLKAERYLYITLFILFILAVTVFYIYDPFNLISWTGLLTPFILFMGILLLAILLWYSFQFTDSDIYQSAEPEKPTSVTMFFLKMFIMVTVIGMISAIVAWSVLNSNDLKGAPYVISLIINILLALSILGIAYRILIKSSIVRSSPYTRLFVSTLLYIPCIFMDLVDSIIRFYTQEKKQTSKSEIVIAGFIVVAIAMYVLVPFVTNLARRKQLGGKVVLNEPVSTKNKTILGTYLQLNDISNDEVVIPYEYNYALSFWVYLYPSPGSETMASTVFTPICDYGGKPTVWYKSDTNSLMITTKLKDLTEERIKAANLDLDEDGNVIIYEDSNMLLQKWNNIIVNFSNDILDIFINGILVKSVGNMLPYMTLDVLSVGDKKGTNASICNVVYYKQALDAMTIELLYDSSKYQDPPMTPNTDSNTLLLGRK